jgi:hypothetical protein
VSTWGQLRLRLQTSSPGVSLDLLDEWLAGRYTAVLAATDWYGLKAHGFIQTLAAYQSAPSESVTLTVGSPLVAGLGTAWTRAIAGLRFYRPGDNVVYTAAFVSAVQLTLDRPYEGITGNAPGTAYPGAPYVLMQDIYALPADARTPVTILNPVNGHPMEEFTKDGMDVSRGTRATVGDPWTFAIVDDTPEPAPPVLHQIQFYPPPQYARGFPLEYIRDPQIFTGENTSASPLPFVTDRVLVEGARADAALYLGQTAQAAGYEIEFQKEVARMLMVEHNERRKKTSFHMAPRFTRHRLARVDRSQGRGWGPNQGGPY